MHYLVQIGIGIGYAEGSWFEENLMRVVSVGVYTYFWFDPWWGVFLSRIGLESCL